MLGRTVGRGEDGNLAEALGLVENGVGNVFANKAGGPEDENVFSL